VLTPWFTLPLVNTTTPLQKTPIPPKTPKIPFNTITPYFHLFFFSIPYTFRKKNTYTLKNGKNDVNRVSALIVNELSTKNDVKMMLR